MEYITVIQFADKFNISERSVRDYCAKGRIEGACLRNGAWLIPIDATKPMRKNKRSVNELLERLNQERLAHITGGIYHKLQIELSYNSNHIEGSSLTHEQTRYIFETNTIGVAEGAVNVDDILEASNHFKCFDMIIDNANRRLSASFIKKLHFLLKSGTTDSQKDWFNVGDYKRLPNEVGGHATTKPAEVKKEIESLLAWYNSKESHTLEEILDFHYRFERIHPFQDGNGRVGRLIMFGECLKNNIVPFIIDEGLKLFYYRGLDKWKEERGYLKDTCLTAQDNLKSYLDYFEISY